MNNASVRVRIVIGELNSRRIAFRASLTVDGRKIDLPKQNTIEGALRLAARAALQEIEKSEKELGI